MCIVVREIVDRWNYLDDDLKYKSILLWYRNAHSSDKLFSKFSTRSILSCSVRQSLIEHSKMQRPFLSSLNKND